MFTLSLLWFFSPTEPDRRRCSAHWTRRLTEWTPSCRATTKPTATSKCSRNSKVLTDSRRPRRTNRFSLTVSSHVADLCTPPCVCQGCVYGEGKVLQPASNGGFEAASYFTNSAASHSAGESRMCCSFNNLRMTSSAWRKLLINDEKSVLKLICWFEWLSSFLHCHLHVLHNTTFT